MSTPEARRYDDLYRSWLERQGEQALDPAWRKRHLLWRHRALLRRYPPRGKRVLDFGCMDGVFTIRLQRMGGEAVGYDISPAAIEQAKRFRGSAARPVFTTVAPGPGQFDLIYCNESLENVEDDSGLVGELTGYLAPGGSVVGTTPVGELTDQTGQRRLYDESLLTRCLAPWGRIRVHRYYRSPLRSRIPFRKKGPAVFLFRVTPPNLPAAR